MLLERSRVFCGVFPTGLVWADRQRMKANDYARLAFLPFNTLELQVEPDCPAELLAGIEFDAARVQARRGQEYCVSTSGQTVLLGGKSAYSGN